MKFLLYHWLFLSLAFSVATAQKNEQEELRALTREALSANPEIAAQFAAMTMFDRRIPQAGALSDPELSVKFMEFPGFRVNEAMSTNVELMQMIPFPTKLGLQRGLARVQSEHSHHDYMEKAISVVAEVKTAAAMLWFARTSFRLNRENQDVAEHILKSAETLHAVGKASQSEVLKSTIELNLLLTEESTLTQEIASAESMLLALLNRAKGSTVGEIELGEAKGIPLSLDQLLAIAAASRPMLLHDSLSVVESGLSLDLMKQEYLPDFKIAVEYIRFPAMKENRWSIGAGLTLPFAPWSLVKASARVEEAEAARRMKSSMYAASRNMVRSRIEDAYAKVLSSQKQWKAYENSIVPLTRQSLQALLTEYQTGRTSFFMVLDTYRMFHAMQRDAAMALMQYHTARARLERELGVFDLSDAVESYKEKKE